MGKIGGKLVKKSIVLSQFINDFPSLMYKVRSATTCEWMDWIGVLGRFILANFGDFANHKVVCFISLTDEIRMMKLMKMSMMMMAIL